MRHMASCHWVNISKGLDKWIRKSTGANDGLTSGKEGTKKGDFSSLFWLESGSGERGEQVFKNGGFLEREKLYPLSRILGDRTVGYRRGKKQSCSPRQGLRVGTSFGKFQQTSEGKGFLLLGLFFI